MKIIQYNGSKEAWNNFVIANSSPASFLQSWEWGEFNEQILGHKIQRLAYVDEVSNLIAVIFGIKKDLPLGKSFYYFPRGLIFDKKSKVKWAELLNLGAKSIRQATAKSVFARINPPYEFADYRHAFFGRLGLIKPRVLTHLKEPGKTWILDLSLDEEELLKKMHPKTRYNIRLAGRKGVAVRLMETGAKAKNLDIFYELTRLTGARDKVKIYAKDYYGKVFEYFVKEDLGDFKKMGARLYVAEYEGKPLAGIMVVYFGDTATYLFGASSNEYRNLMPNHLIQWQAIQDAKKAGMKYYDFWGISFSKHDWAGITRFKTGFGGRALRYLGTWDLVLHKEWYYLFFILKYIKKIIPGK